MPHNRHTKEVHKRERAQLAYHEKRLVPLIRQLRRGITEPPITLPLTSTKDRRSARLAQKRLHKPSHSNHDAEDTTA